MADNKKLAKTRKIIDIEHPGKTAPSPNSKSVIVTHRAIMRDPMMSVGPSADADSSAVAAVTAPHPSTAVIQPLANSELLRAADATKETSEPPVAELPAATQPEASSVEPVTEPVVDATETEAAPVAEAEAAEPSQPATEAQPKTDASKTEVPVSAGSDAKLGTKAVRSDAEVAAAEDAEAKRQVDLQAMIESKKYYLPINTLQESRTKQFVTGGVLLSLLLAVVWADIALDAGLIKIGHLHALTHFFN